MWKKLVVGTAMLAVLGAWDAGSVYVLAQTAPERSGSQFSPADLGAFLEARIAALHAGLQLTPEQERLWPPFEQAFRERGKLRLARAAAGAPPPEQDPIARLQRRADAMLQQGAVLKRLADAAAPLWQSFDEGQKRRYAVLTLPFRARMMMRPGDERSGPGRDGGRFGFDGGRFGRDGGPGAFGPRGFGPQGFGPRGFAPPSGQDGAPGRDDDRGGRGPRGMGPGFGPGFGPGMGPRMRFGGPAGRDGEDFGYDRGRRGPEGGFGRDPRREPDRDFGGGQFRQWRGPPDTGRGDGRQGRDDGNEQL